ncbi:MAG: hypothetical protein ABSD99_11170 [Candidatus Bathyarchaeia archaeon]|jgi:hypothetical protein
MTYENSQHGFRKVRKTFAYSELVSSITIHAQILEFLKKSGYTVTAPKITRGLLGGEEQTFDFSASRDGEEIVFDIASEPIDIGAEAVVAFFAKIFDTKPRRAILICIPGLNRDAKNLTTMYSIQTVTGSDVSQVLSKLSELLGAQPPLHPKPSTENKVRPVLLHQHPTEHPTPLTSTRHCSEQEIEGIAPGRANNNTPDHCQQDWKHILRRWLS